MDGSNSSDEPPVPRKREDLPGERECLPGERERLPGERERLPGERERLPGERERLPGDDPSIRLLRYDMDHGLSDACDRTAPEVSQSSPVSRKSSGLGTLYFI